MSTDIEYKGGITIKSHNGGGPLEVKDLSQLSDSLRRQYDRHIKWSQEHYRKHYSPELWAKADELIAHSKIEFFGDNDASHSLGFGKDGYINGAYERWEQQLVEWADSNKDQVEQLAQQRKQAQAKMEQHRPAVDRIAKTNGANSRAHTDSWKDVAEKLGILKYLTDTGQLSKAKLKKKSKGDSTVITQVLDTYNKQYVAQANAAMAQAKQNKKSHSEADLKERAEYERHWQEVKRIESEIYHLSAGLYDHHMARWSWSYDHIKKKQVA